MWEKGKSGNPAGRPKNNEELKYLAQIHSPKCIEILAKKLDSRDERVQVAAAQVLLDRGYGKAPQSIEVTKPNPFDQITADDVARLRERIIGGGTITLDQTSRPGTEVQETRAIQTISKATRIP